MILGVRSSRSRFWLIWFLVRTLFLACRLIPSHCVFTWPLLAVCVCGRERELSVSTSFRSPIGLGPAFMTSFNLNYLHFKYSHIGRGGIRASTYIGGHGSVHSILWLQGRAVCWRPVTENWREGLWPLTLGLQGSVERELPFCLQGLCSLSL